MTNNNANSQCCYLATRQVWIEVFNSPDNQLIENVGINCVDQLATVSNYSNEGATSNTSDLQAGNYWFDVRVAKQRGFLSAATILADLE
jgi:hypothetical protein